MSELRETTEALELLSLDLGKLEMRAEKVEEKLAEHERHFAAIDMAQQTFENQITIFRDAINEGFRRLREQLRGGRNGHSPDLDDTKA